MIMISLVLALFFIISLPDIPFKVFVYFKYRSFNLQLKKKKKQDISFFI